MPNSMGETPRLASLSTWEPGLFDTDNQLPADVIIWRLGMKSQIRKNQHWRSMCGISPQN